MSFEDYFELEIAAPETKHEWSNGVVYAMSRGSIEHGRLTARMTAILSRLRAGGCEVYAAGTPLYVDAARLSTYADALLVCGMVERKVAMKNGRALGEAVTNPIVIVEVLSESTERYDRDGKFQAYKQIPSLEEYVLVSQEPGRIEVYRRADDDWTCEVADAGGSVTIHGVAVSVDDVYG